MTHLQALRGVLKCDACNGRYTDAATRLGTCGPFHIARALLWSWLAGWVLTGTVGIYKSASLVSLLQRVDHGGTGRGMHRAEVRIAIFKLESRLAPGDEWRLGVVPRKAGMERLVSRKLCRDRATRVHYCRLLETRIVHAHVRSPLPLRFILPAL